MRLISPDLACVALLSAIRGCHVTEGNTFCKGLLLTLGILHKMSFVTACIDQMIISGLMIILARGWNESNPDE
jgi:hypothetical protein